MKKWLIRIIIGIVALVAVVLVGAAFFLGRIVKNRVETIGPRVTLVEVKLDGASVWLLPCRAQLKGLSIGNPPGCKTEVAVKVSDISIRINPLPAFSDKVIIDSVTVKSPEITIEGGLKKNNLTQIQKNVNSYVNHADASPAVLPSTVSQPGKKFQINELVITGARLRIAGLFSTGASVTIALPDIRLDSLGAGESGITSPEVVQKALTALLNSIATNAADAIGKDVVKKFDFKKAGEKLKGLIGQ